MSFIDQVKLKLREFEEPKFDPALSGAHVHSLDDITPGPTLIDGRLINRDGAVIKEWKATYLSLLLPDKRYVAQSHYESKKWGMYSWDDEVIWEKEMAIHHDIIFTPSETLITFTKETRSYKGREVDFGVIVEFDLKGKEIRRYSTWENLGELQSYHRPLELDRPRLFFLPETARRKTPSPWGGYYDYYRLNSIQILPKIELGQKDDRFRAGNWLISFRHGSMIFILDQDTLKVVWKCIDKDVKDRIEGQHAARMLPTGNILIFDNGRYRGYSRVIEIDPLTYDITWKYRADGFFTLSQGYAQRLDNGNTLITESERGRVFEVTPSQKIVWEYYHPEIQDESNSLHPESYGRRQWIYRAVRFPIY